MKRSQSSEDYLECILLLASESEYVHRVDVARKIGVSQPAVQKAINVLKQSGWVESDGMHLHLTKTGEDYARKIYDRHVTIRRFLQLHGVNELDADADACEFEHAVSDATFDMMKAYVTGHK